VEVMEFLEREERRRHDGVVVLLREAEALLLLLEDGIPGSQRPRHRLNLPSLGLELGPEAVGLWVGVDRGAVVHGMVSREDAVHVSRSKLAGLFIGDDDDGDLDATELGEVLDGRQKVREGGMWWLVAVVRVVTPGA
jgi:hypothetical protein